MIKETGSLSINSENILPIIKKWLYSDTDIFVRELVSNAADATVKLSKLAALGEADIPEDEKLYIRVILDKTAETITFSDNGIGMTAEEIKKYINQIAFSGANDFINRYKEKMEAENDIIGHFGLGFYSAFMASKSVKIDTLSYLPGAEAVTWTSDGGTDFEMDSGCRTERGTDITLFINDDSKEFLDEYKLRDVLKKYCAFMPVDIFFETPDAAENDTEPNDIDSDIIDPEAIDADKDKAGKDAPKPVNDKSPLWNKKPHDCTDEEYKEFYSKVFSDFNEPLFWIHLNMDYPFRLKGILYFPKLNHELESIEGQVKLFSNQVFIAENIKEVIPEFLLLLKGVIDCPDLPLNVSRSALQNDGYVTKMSAYITKKVADKLVSLFGGEREQYNKFWDDISPFIKYGCIKEHDFYDKVKAAILLKTTGGRHLTVSEYLDEYGEKTGKRIFYVTDAKQQAQYIKLLNDQGVDAVMLETRIDNPFMSYLESYERENSVKFTRVDSELTDALKEKGEDGEVKDGINTETLIKLFTDSLGAENNKLKIQAEGLKTEDVPAIVILSEHSRRMQEMSRMFPGMSADMWDSETILVLNCRNPLIKTLYGFAEDESRAEDAKLICEHIRDLAMMSHKQLDAGAMNAFIARSNVILQKIIQN